jgi:hypothetical protein
MCGGREHGKLCVPSSFCCEHKTLLTNEAYGGGNIKGKGKGK